jgi:hypothetical protein
VDQLNLAKDPGQFLSAAGWHVHEKYTESVVIESPLGFAAEPEGDSTHAEGNFNPNPGALRKMRESAQPATLQTDLDQTACHPRATVQEEEGCLFIQPLPGMSATFRSIRRLAVSGTFGIHGKLPDRDEVKTGQSAYRQDLRGLDSARSAGPFGQTID